MEQQAQGLVHISNFLSAILLISTIPVVNLLNSSNKNVIQTFGREPFSRPNFIRAPNSLPRHSPFFSFLFVSILDLCVHSAIDIFNFRVTPIRESCPKAVHQRTNAATNNNSWSFLKERNLQKLRTGIRDGLLLERLFARSHDAKSSEKQRIAAFSL